MRGVCVGVSDDRRSDLVDTNVCGTERMLGAARAMGGPVRAPAAPVAASDATEDSYYLNFTNDPEGVLSHAEQRNVISAVAVPSRTGSALAPVGSPSPSSSISVGKGPWPTRVVNALTTP